MKKFLILYCATPEMLKQWSAMSEEEGKKGMEEWTQWQEAHKDALVDPGMPVGKNTRLSMEGSEEVSNAVCGYSVLQAESKEDAAKILADNPHTKQAGAYLEVMELIVM